MVLFFLDLWFRRLIAVDDHCICWVCNLSSAGLYCNFLAVRFRSSPIFSAVLAAGVISSSGCSDSRWPHLVLYILPLGEFAGWHPFDSIFKLYASCQASFFFFSLQPCRRDCGIHKLLLPSTHILKSCSSCCLLVATSLAIHRSFHQDIHYRSKQLSQF